MELLLIGVFTFTLLAAVAYLGITNQRLREESAQMREHKATAEALLLGLRERLARAEAERDEARTAKDHADHARHQAEKQEHVVRQKLKDTEEKIIEWDAIKQQHMEATKASLADIGAKLSSKLLDDHKRETEASRQESEKRNVKAAEEFQKVVSAVHTLDQRITQSAHTVSMIENALLHPSSAGALSETTLYNMFKNLNLSEGRDYFLQHHIGASETSGTLKPDAVVCIRSGAMVIDSKASKFFLEIEKEKDRTQKEALTEQLKKTMNDHLKALVSRNYRDAIIEQLSKAGQQLEAKNVTVYMFLPSEAAVERLYALDPKFQEKALKERILPVGPTGLYNQLMLAELLVAQTRQDENAQHIVEEVKKLVASIAKLYEYASKLGKGLQNNVKTYDEFARSFNRTFLAKIKQLRKLGITTANDKPLELLDTFEVVSRTQVIDGTISDESEEAQTVKEAELLLEVR